jgi:hypothetical protein
MKAGQSVTTTTVYPPGGKQPYATNTGQHPQSQTFVTTIPLGGTRGAYNDGMQELAPMHLRRAPIKMRSCPSCQQATRTRIRTWPNIFTWIACLILLILFWPICWIPLVCDIFKQTDHFCNTCGTKVGDVQPFTDCCEKRRA